MIAFVALVIQLDSSGRRMFARVARLDSLLSLFQFVMVEGAVAAGCR